ncbi:MAG: FtsW/RodA/SpoVE family cell cycle protein [Saprospiraceae bacterium]
MTTAKDILLHLKGDKAVWAIVLMLFCVSILAVYSAAGTIAWKNYAGNTERFLIQQLLFVLMGITVVYILSNIKYMYFHKIAPWLIITAVPLLIITMAAGVEINEARRWINIPFLNRTIQTSDFARIALIIFVARSLSKKQDFIKDFQSAFVPIIFPIILICFLIALEDFSTAGLLFVTCLMMIFIGRVSMKYIILLILLGIVALTFILLIAQYFPDFTRVDTGAARLNEFFGSTGGYQIDLSKTAIASGEFFGAGPGNSMQKNYLPSAYADFIYSIICEEYGLLGGFTILGIYMWLLFRCINIVTRCPKTFGAILAMGLGLNIVIQALTNIAVSVHLVPVTGLTLPLVSMGGTSVLFTCVSFGMILSVSRFIDQNNGIEKEITETDIRHAFSV